MSSGICKNEKEDKKEEKRENKNTFKFWIYMAFIILGLLLLIIIIVIIYSLLSKHPIDTTTINKPITNSQSLPLFNSTSINSVQNLSPPNLSTTNISIPHPTEVKKPFLSTLMSDTTKKTNQAISTIGKTTSETIKPLLNRKIPVNKTGGFRCMNRRRI